MDSKQYETISKQIEKIAKGIENLDKNTTPDKPETFESVVSGNDILAGLYKGATVSVTTDDQNFEALINASEL